jgi:NAD+ synthase
MRELQRRIIDELGVRAAIEPEREVRNRIDFIKQYTIESGAVGLVLGISGGQDSSLTGRLCQLAAQELRAEGATCTFVAVRLPYGVQQDEADAQNALGFIHPDETVTFNIKSSVDAAVDEYAAAVGRPITDFNKGNVKARMRMLAQFAIAGDRRMLVVGTDHAAEAVSGFFTKYGDGATDLMPISGLTKAQGAEMLQYLEADEALWLKTPTADLLDSIPSQSDEESLGTSYRLIDAYLCGEQVPDEIAETIEARYLATAHKRHLPVTPADYWWK